MYCTVTIESLSDTAKIQAQIDSGVLFAKFYILNNDWRCFFGWGILWLFTECMFSGIE